MNVFSHEFCPENKTYLLNFLKISTEQKASKFCDSRKHASWNRYFPLNKELKRELKDYIEKQNAVIDITVSDAEAEDANELMIIRDACLEETLHALTDIKNQSTIDDLAHSIKEHLETRKCLSNTVLNSLCEYIDKKDVFSLLSEQLNIEEIINFGIFLETANIDDNIISYYIRFLLIKKLTLEYSDQLQIILNQFTKTHPNILLDELVTVLLSSESQCKLFLQFVDGLHIDFKTKLFRKFIFSCENCQEDYIGIVEILINTQVEYNTLNKLIEMFSNSASNFAYDKSFGKLLIKVIQLLGKNVVSVEQPLKHIIACHKSVWKSKIQKAFDDCLEDSSIHSQSFRY